MENDHRKIVIRRNHLFLSVINIVPLASMDDIYDEFRKVVLTATKSA